MKKTILMLTGLFLLGISTARADHDKAVSIAQLPRVAQQFIQEYFAMEKVAYAKKERDFFEVKYEVIFTSGKKVGFYRNGDWKDVDCRYATVPAGIVPAPIMAKARELYGDVAVLEIDRDKLNYEVKLTNGLELTFDLCYNLLDIDD